MRGRYFYTRIKLTPACLGRLVWFPLNCFFNICKKIGGGYHHANTARLWTSITAALVNTPNKPYQKDDDSYMGISINIPEHIYFPLYKPDFTIFIPTGNRIDENMLVSKEDNGKTYIEKVLEVLLSLISETNYE